MIYNKIGKSGLYVSKLCLGTMAFGNLADEKECFRIMDEAVDNGILFFDCANVYGANTNKITKVTTGYRGYSEEIVGKWFAQGGGRREKVVLLTKFNAPDGDSFGANNKSGLSAFKVRRSLDDCLKRLQTDHVEILMMHRIDRTVSWAELWPAFTIAQEQGKCDYIASSAFAGHEIVTAQAEAEKRGLLGLIADEHRFNLICRYPELEVLPALQKLGMGMLVYSPLGGGHFSGHTLENPGPRAAGRALPEYQVEQLKKFDVLCKELGYTQPQVAMAWVLKNPVVSSVLCGPRNVEMLKEAVTSLDVKLDDEVMKKLDAIFPGYGPATEAYNW